MERKCDGVSVEYLSILALKSYLFQLSLFMGLVFVWALAAPFGMTDEIYKYQDEQGNWHFSERSSKKEGEEKIQIQGVDEKRIFKNVWVKEYTGNPPSLSVINNYFGPVQAVVSIECEKCSIKNKMVNLVVDAQGNEFAFKIDPQVKNWKADYELNIVLGRPDAKPDVDFKYRLPFEDHKEFLVTQSFNGAFSHNEEGNEHALDIGMPIATPVLAARGGTVMAIEESNTEAGIDPGYASKANSVYVLHSDGTIGVYAHLDMFSVTAQPGDMVNTGDLLARSGNTGFSTGPHLHFSVWINENGVQKSINHKYDDGVGGSFLPAAGHLITQSIGKVKLEIAEGYEQTHQDSLSNLALLEGSKSSEDNEEGFFEKAKATGKTYLDSISELFN